MDIAVIDGVGVMDPRAGLHIGQDLTGAFPGNAKIQGLAVQVPAVDGGIRLVCVMLLAADPAGSDTGTPEMLPHIIRQLHKGLVRFHGETIAVWGVVFSAAASEFFPGPVTDMVPECTGSIVRRRRVLRPEAARCYGVQQSRLGNRAGASVGFQDAILLAFP